jgi:hypothetical protein
MYDTENELDNASLLSNEKGAVAIVIYVGSIF